MTIKLLKSSLTLKGELNIYLKTYIDTYFTYVDILGFRPCRLFRDRRCLGLRVDLSSLRAVSCAYVASSRGADCWQGKAVLDRVSKAFTLD